MYRSPSDFADRLGTELAARGQEPPSAEMLRAFAQTLFAVSLKTEEGQPVLAQCVFIDPEDPDPNPPERITADRWTAIPLGVRTPFTAEDIVKLASATDPRTSSLAVHGHPDTGLFIWGLLDQANRYHDFMNFDSDSGPTVPGEFHIAIEGPGHLSAWIGYDRIAALRVSELLGLPVDALRNGPLRDALEPAIQTHISEILKAVPKEAHDYREHWPSSIAADWLSVLCRLLLRARNYRHGGAVLIAPDRSGTHLNIKHQLRYKRLSTALVAAGIERIGQIYASDEIHEKFLEGNQDELPLSLYLDESVHRSEVLDIESEIDGSLWFTSLLTRVDGLLLMTPRLEVSGFGVEITADAPPENVVQALDPSAKERATISYTRYGTRHRSMMRYCHAMPGSVGFVISQDGDVRAMLAEGGDVVVWENLKLQFHNFHTD